LSSGISLEGRIALVKYGGNFRGLKIKGELLRTVLQQFLTHGTAAQEAGAIACLIFSDPGDDGEITQENGYEAYPDGPARQPSSVQRGSVQFVSIGMRQIGRMMTDIARFPSILAIPLLLAIPRMRMPRVFLAETSLRSHRACRGQ
jgi:hypothetical protein